jgi:F-type H+-transporting ATPase subunit epsilon
MADVLKVEIVTPSGMAVARDALELDAPTLGGEIGILPGHVPLLAAVRTGIVTLKPPGSSDEPLRFAVSYGVLEVANDKALLLTENFVKKEDVDVVKVRARLKDVGDELTGWEGDTDDAKRVALIEEEQWLAAELELIGDPPAPTMRELTRFQTKEEDVVPEAQTEAEAESNQPKSGE